MSAKFDNRSLPLAIEADWADIRVHQTSNLGLMLELRVWVGSLQKTRTLQVPLDRSDLYTIKKAMVLNAEALRMAANSVLELPSLEAAKR